MTEDRDIVVFADEEGNDFEMEVIDYFFYEGQEYAVLAEPCSCEDGECDGCEECEDECACGEDCCGHDHNLYIMKVVQLEGEMEEFVPVEDGLMETLIQIVQTRFDEDMEDEEEVDDEE